MINENYENFKIKVQVNKLNSYNIKMWRHEEFGWQICN